MTASVDGSLRPLDVRVSSHGIFSDSHPLLALLALDADGPSCIEETVWTERFAYVEGLCRLGADVVRSGARVRVAPGRAWRAGEHVVAGDLRAAAVYVVAALGIDGTTRVDGVEHLDRGYAGFLANLRRLGASIEVDG